MVELGWPRRKDALCMPVNQSYRHTQNIVIFIVFPLQQWLRERATACLANCILYQDGLSPTALSQYRPLDLLSRLHRCVFV
jgi:hypothetical protein